MCESRASGRLRQPLACADQELAESPAGGAWRLGRYGLVDPEALGALPAQLRVGLVVEHSGSFRLELKYLHIEMKDYTSNLLTSRSS